MKKVYNKVIEIMPPRTLTSQEILRQLNGPTGVGPWREIPTLNILPLIEVKGPSSISTSLGSGIVVKTFLNSQTAEIKIFLAKAFDIPERSNL